jgi:hypothetical protein
MEFAKKLLDALWRQRSLPHQEAINHLLLLEAPGHLSQPVLEEKKKTEPNQATLLLSES